MPAICRSVASPTTPALTVSWMRYVPSFCGVNVGFWMFVAESESAGPAGWDTMDQRNDTSPPVFWLLSCTRTLSGRLALLPATPLMVMRADMGALGQTQNCMVRVKLNRVVGPPVTGVRLKTLTEMTGWPTAIVACDPAAHLVASTR